MGCVLAATVTMNTPAAAEGELDTAGIEFDFNADGVTDKTDWEELRSFVKTYRMEEDGTVYFASQEVPETIRYLLNDQYGSRQSEGYGIDVSRVPEYYLPSLGLSTRVKSQGSFGTCWAFASLSSVESNLLLQRSGKAGILDPAGYELKLNNESDELDLSELYLAYIAFSPAKEPQSGEGTVPHLKEDMPNAVFSLGGFSSSSQEIFTSWNGILPEAQEPYKPLKADEDGGDIYGLWNEAKDEETAPLAHVQKFVYLNAPTIMKPDLEDRVYRYIGRDDNAVDLMKQAMVKYGALMLGYKSDNSRPDEEKTGEYYNYINWAQYDDRDELGFSHMVSVVGWNDAYPKENFQAKENELPPGDGAFLIKNSWGSYQTNHEEYGEAMEEALKNAEGTEVEAAMNRSYNYGIPDEDGHGSGYFWLSYYDHSILNVCALEADDAADGFAYDNIYQYDFSRPFASEISVLPADNEETRVANVFTVNGNERLEAVSVYAPQAGCTAEITVYSVNGEGAEVASGALLAQETATLSEKGFHTISLETPVTLSSGEKFTVVERIRTEHEGKPISWLNLETTVKQELQTDENIGELRTVTVSSPGESYAYVKSENGFVWTDIETLNRETDASQVFTFGNALIKAYTTDIPEMADGTGTLDPNHIQNRIPVYVLCGVLAGIIVALVVKNRKPKQ